LGLRVVSDDVIGALTGKSGLSETQLTDILKKHTISTWTVKVSRFFLLEWSHDTSTPLLLSILFSILIRVFSLILQPTTQKKFEESASKSHHPSPQNLVALFFFLFFRRLLQFVCPLS
uniref:Cation_ATPase_N domain-containing protein n=1 Tax=Echinostoma caproni TaxID=27848 RepID=A0A183A306_9TREM